MNSAGHGKKTHDDPLQAPIMQEMATDFTEVEGVVVRQVTQYVDAVALAAGLAYEAKNKYQVAALPQGKVPAETKARDEKYWYPTAADLKGLDEIMFIQEESSFLNRVFMACIGCLNLRPLKLHFMERGTDVIVADRPYKIGGCCGCPLEMRIRKGNTLIGKAIENFEPYGTKCYEFCCLCTSYTSVQMDGKRAYKFTLRRSNCCCGRVNNCCGATCLNETLIIDVLDSSGKMVGVITRYYAPGLLQGRVWVCEFCTEIS
eukprot:jgi/Picre1/30842/NNA_006202.t1